MKTSRASVMLLTAISAATITGCGVQINTSAGSGTPATISVSPTPASIPVGTSVTFTATVSSNAKSDASWTFGNNGYVTASADLGTLATPSGNTVVYTAPATPPIYTANSGITQGVVTIEASVPDPGTFNSAVDEFSFVITAPSITTGISPATATVPLGSTLPVYAYAVGAVNNAITMQVAGVTGGATATGTIALTANVPGQYTYTAPATMPMTGSTVTITVVSQADPTKISSATITLQ
ncbi:MAG: hypothetical protein WBY53_18280 [Acidobacteriaceae bacterium]